MATLNQHQKMFIVQRLACFDTLAECIEHFKEEYGLALSPQQIQCYHPHKRQGSQMSKALKDLFEETRNKYRENTHDIPIANKTFRVEQLNSMAATAKKKGNLVLAASLYEQAAKEMGEAYTNRQKMEHTSPDGSMTPAAPVVVDQSVVESLVNKLTN